VAALLLCLNCQLLKPGVFAFSVCLSSFNNSAGDYMRHEGHMMDPNFWALLADVLLCFRIYQSHYAVLIRFGWCVLIALRWLVALALCYWSYLS
jgi:hypothetical protein